MGTKTSNAARPRSLKTNRPNATKQVTKLSLFIACILALVCVAQANRALLQGGSGLGYGAQFFNPQYWASFYQQAIPYDIYANWVNRNTGFTMPVITGPGLPTGAGST